MEWLALALYLLPVVEGLTEFSHRVRECREWIEREDPRTVSWAPWVVITCLVFWPILSVHATAGNIIAGDN